MIRTAITILIVALVGIAAAETYPENNFPGTADQLVTLRAQVRVNAYSEGIGNYIISAFNTDNPKELLFGLRMSGTKLEFVTVAEIENGKLQYRGLTSKTDLPLNKVLYVCAVRTTNSMSLYINGRSEATRSIVTNTPQANRIRIGAECRTDNPARDIKGLIKNAQVFPAAWTSREVVQDYSKLTNSAVELIQTQSGIYLPVSLPAKPVQFPNAPARLNLDLRFLEAFLPEGQFLSPLDVKIVKWDSKNKKPSNISVEFRTEYDLYPKTMTIVWQRTETTAADYAVCFNGPVSLDKPAAPIPLIGAGEPLSVGHTDLTSAGQGLAGYPVILDYNNDGLDDLLISYVIPRRIFFYENIGTVREPVYKAPEIAFAGKSLLTVDMFQQSDGTIYAYSCKNQIVNLWKSLDTPEGKTIEHQAKFPLAGLAEDEVFDISLVDANADGTRDLLIGAFSGTWWWDGSDPWNKGHGNPNIGYGRGYDQYNKWYGDPPVGSVYLVLNNGTDTEPEFAPAQKLNVNGRPIEIPTTQMSVALADINVDGTLDLLLGCGVDQSLIYYNTSKDPTRIELALPVGAYRDSTVSQYSYFDQRFEVCDYNHDGKTDILVGSNPGITVVCEIENSLLVETEILEFAGANLWSESLVVPTIVDLNGDGLWDVVTGDASGFLNYFANSGTKTSPIFATREKLKVGGKIFRPTAGYSGSIQGPNESRWGYLAPNPCDFNGDGKTDVVLSDITGYNYWLKNIAPRKNDYEFADPQYLDIDTWPLKNRWRTRPAMWYTDKNLKTPSALVTSDPEGFLTLYPRDLIKGPAALAPGKRLKFTTGSDIKLDGPSGYNGRSKFCAVDYNTDGITDLLVGQPRRGMTNAGQRYDLAVEPYAYVAILINAGTNAEPVFKPARTLALADGEKLYYGTHSCSPAVWDYDGDGRQDIFIGTERGYVRCFNRALFDDDSQIISIPK